MQTIIASIVKITPDKAAEVADRMLDLTPSNISAVSAITPTTDAQTLAATEMLINEIQALR